MTAPEFGKKESGQGLDWLEVKRRLAESIRQLEDRQVESRERDDATLRERAAALAAGGGDSTPTDTKEQVLVFTLAEERYCIPTSAISGVMPMTCCVPVPGAPAWMLGLVNHRGELHAVIDLAVLLSLPAAGPRDTGLLLSLRPANLQVALRVDEAETITAVATDEHWCDSPDDKGEGRLIQGVTPDGLPLIGHDLLLAHPVLAGRGTAGAPRQHEANGID